MCVAFAWSLRHPHADNGQSTITEAVNEDEEACRDDDDSFDSDCSDEAYSRLHPQCLEESLYSSNSLERQESQGSSDLPFATSGPTYQRQSSLGSATSGTQSITKIAEAANIGMQKLKRNWSQTKTEVKTGLNKMKKKNNAPLAFDGRSIENIYNDASPTSEDKRKWSFKNHFVRRKSTTSLISSGQSLSFVPDDREKETATFYLTLTIETDKRDAALAAAAAEASHRLKGMGLRDVDLRNMDIKNMEILKGVDGNDLKSVLGLGRVASVGVVQRPKSYSGYADHSHGKSAGVGRGRPKSSQKCASNPRPVRPKNAPPAPPSDYSESDDGRSPDGQDLSKDKLALRLNQLLSAGPTRPQGRKILRSSVVPQHFNDVDRRDQLDFSKDAGMSHARDEPTYISSHFADEPLYQFYTASVMERATYRQGECSSEDDYEVINDGSGGAAVMAALPRPTAMEIVTPADGRRTLWCELQEVIMIVFVDTLTSGQRKVQEAMFEVITSEASYLKSLDVLVSHFLNCPAFASEAVISKREKNILFSDILPVKRCSEAFLADLEKRWQESAMISTIADIVLKHAGSTFGVYVKYCSNQIYQDRMLKTLKENNPRFLEVLTDLESSPKCQSLAMHSFLMLPMQRITRLPLLLDAIFHRLEQGSPHWHECNLALATLNKIVTECNEGARKMERMEEMLIISRQLDFREVRAVPLISASRWLVKKGELTRLTLRDLDAKLTFGKRISKHTLYFFLFTDLLVVTKRKSEDSYTVLDHCPRNMVQVLELENSDKPPGRWLEGHKNLLIVTMLQNHENKTVEMVLSCALESERTRWVEAVTPRTSDNPDEQIYEEWDCPQVQASHAYVGSQPDELSLEVSDVVNVLKKMADGLYINPLLTARGGVNAYTAANPSLPLQHSG
ncbi:hypothetical protein HAZT_HAZT000590 [Hyalella azteca]|uniref:DH domain-containing protein n=1 Tax=Hyalella azteca TaxID=294128 RepID=A0A6A0HA38_HYAAZ|nr:hypothetical protein HAZT_HAZT000590 [Hyalella azteca]